MSARETGESLTLDMEARERAMRALQTALDGGWETHDCDVWDEDNDGGCSICWNIAADVIRAAEGFKCCERCKGTGQPGPEGDACPECGGDGLEPIALDEKQDS